MELRAWTVHAPGEPMVEEHRSEEPGPGEVVVQVAGCGVCHTDMAFFYEGVPTRHPLPLTLGHEISGRVVEAGEGAEGWVGRPVVVPAVIPCGECPACRSGKGSICPEQIFPGNDVHGGFATHVRVPARGLCRVPEDAGQDLGLLSVLADAVTTPYQAVKRSGLQAGDLAVVVGAGGVGGFAVQIAAARGALVAALDVDQERLDLVQEHGADLCIRPDAMEFRALRKAVAEFAEEREIPTWRWRIFECSGAPQGQATAFGLLQHGGYLSVVGYTPAKVEVRLSNLMAFDATVQGNWGCLPEHYPAALELVLSGKVALDPFTERRPMAGINDTFADLRDHRVKRRVVLSPEQ